MALVILQKKKTFSLLWALSFEARAPAIFHVVNMLTVTDWQHCRVFQTSKGMDYVDRYLAAAMHVILAQVIQKLKTKSVNMLSDIDIL